MHSMLFYEISVIVICIMQLAHFIEHRMNTEH